MFNTIDLTELLYEKTISGMPYFTHYNLVVVGDNSAGKSTLLKSLLDTIQKNNREDFYYIDSQNRVVIDRKHENLSRRYSDYNIKDIIKTRKDKDNFSKADYFDENTTGGVATFSELWADIDGYSQFISEFMTWTLNKGSKLKPGSIVNGSDTILINNEIDIEAISSSEAAKIRLLMEMKYAKDSNCKVVIIDEFDDHFDTENMVLFIEKVVDYFENMRFIFVIHNFETLVRLKNMDAIIYNNDRTAPVDIIPIDCDDITELGQVYKVRNRYIGQKNDMEIFLDGCIAGIIKSEILEKEQMDRIKITDRQQLNTKEKILFDYIIGHIKNEN